MTSHDPQSDAACNPSPANSSPETRRQAAPSQREMSAAEAVERIRAGRTVSNARIVGLVFQGEFPDAIKMENVTLVRPRFAGARFRDVVGLYRSTLSARSAGR